VAARRVRDYCRSKGWTERGLPDGAQHHMLSPAQIEARKGRLTASRVGVLMTGDTAAIMRLYRELLGEVPEEDLSDVWPVQLGAETEPLNLRWYARRRNPLSRHGEVVVHPRYDWATARSTLGTICCPARSSQTSVATSRSKPSSIAISRKCSG
jgi:hypothetical protein